MSKWIFHFGSEKNEGNASLKNLLGGKGANLAEMSRIGLPVPPGFTISTDLCNYFYNNHKKYPSSLESELMDGLSFIENQTNKKFASNENPLLLSIRSGSRVSMPGMMDTILNLGINDKSVISLAKKTNDKRFAFDSYRRFIQMYSDVVLNLDGGLFEDALEHLKLSKRKFSDTELNGDDLAELVEIYKEIVFDGTKANFPQNPLEQLWAAISSVFLSWKNKRAVTYRKLNSIPDNWGTAVNVQAMVFGNMGKDCATGVAFTRNPSTGENTFFGEYLINAQGEDVVAGIRTPGPLSIDENSSDMSSLEEKMSKVYLELLEVRSKLEKHYGDMQDLEFTIEKNKLYMLQTRSGKRSAEAGIRIAVEMAEQNLISKKDAILRVNPESLEQLLHPTLDANIKRDCLAKGLPASPGAACGVVVLSSELAEKKANDGEDVILVRMETSPEDIHGMHAAKGILTARGGMTSHAAVVARGMGRACVSGAGDLRIDLSSKIIFLGEVQVAEGDTITIDGSSGEVYLGQAEMSQPSMSKYFKILMDWAGEIRRLKIRTNAETPKDTKIAKNFGADGIGLCRTEHMFFDNDRILSVREMIMSVDTEGRKKALEKLLPMQRNDFIEIFRIMSGLPVTIRLLDPPLHEFLPQSEHELDQVSKILNISKDTVRQRIAKLSEVNPMLGHRGCRLAITYPEIYSMQAQAIFEAIAVVKSEKEIPEVEVMIPLAATDLEIKICKELIDNVANIVFKEKKTSFHYKVGTMIELPRAALCASELAKEADFFSFGTNDLTQTALGISRDDSNSFIHHYIEKNIYDIDPFISIDREGVGYLVKLAVNEGRKIKPEIKLGICGEHGGDPKSIDFFEEIGLDYVSCSPFRVPIAKLAAAQAHIRVLNKND